MASNQKGLSRLFGNAMGGLRTQNTRAAPHPSPDDFVSSRTRGAAVRLTPAPGKGDFGPVRNGRKAGSKQAMLDPYSKDRWTHDKFEDIADPEDLVGSTIFVRGLPKGTQTRVVTQIFGKYGEILSCKIDDGPLCTATISFARKDAGLRAEKELHLAELQGKVMKVKVVEQDQARRRAGRRDEYDVAPARRGGKGGGKGRGKGAMGGQVNAAGRSFIQSSTQKVSIFDRFG